MNRSGWLTWPMPAFALALVLAGCQSAGTAPSPAPSPTASQPAASPPAPDPVAPRELLRQTVTVEPGRPAAAQVLLHAGSRYIIYAGPADPQEPVQPHLAIRNHRGELLGENSSFRNDLFAAVAVALDYDSQAAINVDCTTRQGGALSLRVEELGQLAPGQSISGALADFQTFHFYSVAVAAGDRFEAETSQLGPEGDTLLTVHRFPSLDIIAENDDISPRDASSEVLWHSRDDGVEVVAVTSWTAEGAGSYTLSLRRLQVLGG